LWSSIRDLVKTEKKGARLNEKVTKRNKTKGKCTVGQNGKEKRGVKK